MLVTLAGGGPRRTRSHFQRLLLESRYVKLLADKRDAEKEAAREKKRLRDEALALARAQREREAEEERRKRSEEAAQERECRAMRQEDVATGEAAKEREAAAQHGEQGHAQRDISSLSGAVAGDGADNEHTGCARTRSLESKDQQSEPEAEDASDDDVVLKRKAEWLSMFNVTVHPGISRKYVHEAMLATAKRSRRTTARQSDIACSS